MSKAKLERQALVYLLKSKYKDYDTEVLGVYTSLEAFKEGFGDLVKTFESTRAHVVTDEEVEQLLTACLNCDECKINFTEYSYEELPLLKYKEEEHGA